MWLGRNRAQPRRLPRADPTILLQTPVPSVKLGPRAASQP